MRPHAASHGHAAHAAWHVSALHLQQPDSGHRAAAQQHQTQDQAETSAPVALVGIHQGGCVMCCRTIAASPSVVIQDVTNGWQPSTAVHLLRGFLVLLLALQLQKQTCGDSVQRRIGAAPHVPEAAATSVEDCSQFGADYRLPG